MADASPVGLGAVLMQGGSKGKQIISYASKSLSDQEKRYSQTEKQALALVWALEKFHTFLYGRTLDLLTDQRPLQ
uniref:RT_RNaseH domain-containing protein n=1 Tax=Rhodnius prolixus TaxID=13249 RepID=T1HJ34_RHOPR